MKILGLDVGEKRIGVAVAENNLVTSYGIVDNSNYQSAILEITKICNQEKIVQIVVGVPEGRDSYQADKIRSFAMELTKQINLPVVYIDETLTSSEAERELSSSSLNKKSEKYKEEVDKISARLILEQYLAKNKKH